MTVHEPGRDMHADELDYCGCFKAGLAALIVLIASWVTIVVLTWMLFT